MRAAEFCPLEIAGRKELFFLFRLFFPLLLGGF